MRNGLGVTQSGIITEKYDFVIENELVFIFYYIFFNKYKITIKITLLYEPCVWQSHIVYHHNSVFYIGHDQWQ